MIYGGGGKSKCGGCGGDEDGKKGFPAIIINPDNP